MPSETKCERAVQLAREAGIPLERPFFRDVGPYDITEPMPCVERLIAITRAEAFVEAAEMCKLIESTGGGAVHCAEIISAKAQEVLPPRPRRGTGGCMSRAETKVVAWGCWSNEMPIAEEGQCGVLHGRLFESRDAAEKWYKGAGYHSNSDDPIVLVTVEIVNEPL